MKFQTIGKPIKRYDAAAKVTGKAMYAGDFDEQGMLIAKILRSTIAHGYVKKIDTDQAKNLSGVEAVITFEDVSQNAYPTAGHPYVLDPKKRDIADKTLLTDHVRYFGDEIAAVIAENEFIAKKALDLIKVEYEPLPIINTVEEALDKNAPEIHKGSGNIVGKIHWDTGDPQKALLESDYIFEDEITTGIAQHCHLENHTSYAYVDHNGRIVIVSSTQIPHIVRRIVSQALLIDIKNIRVIKPYIGGGFGAKQDACIEPLNAALTLAVGGRPVKIELEREECMIGTRVRHAAKYKFKTGVSKDGIITAKMLEVSTAKGGYASHGIAPIAKNGTIFKLLYPCKNSDFSALSVYSNHPSAGAMRAYGVPQITFALESHIENIATKLNMDPIEFRLKNLIKQGHKEPSLDLEIFTCGIRKCIEKGKELIDWDKKKAAYKNQEDKDIRKGVGMACFCYGTGTYPACLEVAGARLILRQDGSVTLQVGATEIGQGSDTALSQIAAEAAGITPDKVYLESCTDTDTSPFDTGAYASRQTYVSGTAVKQAALKLKEKILNKARTIQNIQDQDINIKDNFIIAKKDGKEEKLIALADLAMAVFYDIDRAEPIEAQVSSNVHTNCQAFGVTFAEVKVDIKTGKIEITDIFNVHDSGTIINRSLAEGQVHGGVAMGIGYAISEELKFDPQTARPLNNDLLDYKIPTSMDVVDIGAEFIETDEPTAPFGNKALGEPPVITPAPAIRNAVLDATKIAFDSIPMTPQKLFEKFKEKGLI